MSDNHDLLNDKDVCSNKDAVARRVRGSVD